MYTIVHLWYAILDFTIYYIAYTIYYVIILYLYWSYDFSFDSLLSEGGGLTGVWLLQGLSWFWKARGQTCYCLLLFVISIIPCWRLWKVFRSPPCVSAPHPPPLAKPRRATKEGRWILEPPPCILAPLFFSARDGSKNPGFVLRPLSPYAKSPY